MYLTLTFRSGRRCLSECKLPGSVRWPVILICLFLAGCSATQFIYNKLDWILVWTLSDSFSLDDEQEEQLRVLVERNLQWHRRNQLPEYAQLLRDIEYESSRGNLTLETLERHYVRFVELWDEFIVQATPDITSLILGLNRPQVEEFMENLEKSNEKLWKKFAGRTPKERKKRRQDTAVRWLERLFGSLSHEQKKLVRSYMNGLHDVSFEWMAGRRQWQQDFYSLFVEHPPEPEFTDRIMHLMLEPNESDASEYRHRVEENRRTIMNMVVALHAELTGKQRERFSKKLKKFAKSFEILAGQKT